RRHTRCLSDWSSDVCSSDLIACTPVGVGSSARDRQERPHAAAVGLGAQDAQEGALDISGDQRATVMEGDGWPQVKDVTQGTAVEIGRASCRERGEVEGGEGR